VRDRDLEHAAEELRRRRRWSVSAVVLGAAAGAVALPALALSTPVALALAAGGVFECVVALEAVYARRQLIARLALHPAAYKLPEVAAYGTRAAELPQRARLAAWIFEIVAEARSPQSLYLGDRVDLVAQDLQALAHELVSPARSVAPESAVACRRLLTRMTESPLYNPGLPLEDLHLALHRIRAGIA
jgi:membrane glycosyltransferase